MVDTDFLATVPLGDDSVSDTLKICYLQGVYDGNDYSKYFGARISSIFVIFFVSTFLTMFPLLALRFKSLRIPLYGYLFARYFGTGVIIATAYVHLMDPAYGEIGPNTCVGMTGNWAIYSWPPALMLGAVFFVFLTDIISSVWVERKYGVVHSHDANVEDIIIAKAPQSNVNEPYPDENQLENLLSEKVKEDDVVGTASVSETEAEVSFRLQFYAFLVLEFGVIFHSVMIGLNLGALAADEFRDLYIVLVFHQSFEGLGIGARLSAIEFPHEKRWWPWICCVVYGLVTPVCIGIGLGVRSTYASNSYAANVVQGVLDSLSAGILMYTGLVELLARDFIFDENRTKDLKQLTFMVITTMLGTGIMALLGKWA